VRTVVNDEVIAENRVRNMHFSPQELVAFHSGVMTLERGDIVATGIAGAGRIEPGDTIRAVVEGVGSVVADVVR
jgi:2-keto-4-pentenoate hydratase/2-oxohepta-3-ene-1,7-dioic acid hydratase in catechol pathway